MSLNFNEVLDVKHCDLYLQDLAAFLDFQTVCNATRAFRNAFGPRYAKGFLIDVDTINQLLKQNGGNISGIRVYLGLDNSTNPIASAVATVKLPPYDYADFSVPDLQTSPCTSLLGEARPCPYQCSPDNALNKD